MDMGTDQVQSNEEIVRRYLVSGWGENQPQILEELLDPNCRRHLNGTVTGGNKAVETLRAFRFAFPDASVIVELLFGKDDLVVCRSITTGTHSEAYLGIPASGRSVSISAVDFFRLKNGLITESWHNVDEIGMRRAMGQDI